MQLTATLERVVDQHRIASHHWRGRCLSSSPTQFAAKASDPQTIVATLSTATRFVIGRSTIRTVSSFPTIDELRPSRSTEHPAVSGASGRSETSFGIGTIVRATYSRERADLV